jgi:GTP-binding protein HflX
MGVQKERALLVGVITEHSNVDPHDPLGELRSLSKTAGAWVVDEMLCKRQRVNPGLYVGTGKADEIAARAEQNEIDTIIFDNDLSPAQIRDLEKITKTKVLDRSELILDIFAAHARTSESRLQVELAQMEYTYPRLTNMWSHLERMAGGAATSASAVGGIGTRGPGEKQLEIDRRLVSKRMSMLKRQLKEIDERKVREVSSRREVFSVCLVGYTNAGKSTLMNLLTDAQTYVADKLFATLDTKTRRWNVGQGAEVLLSDTVGFVRDLPHHLVASFRATLEEAVWADLLIHVADASHERVVQQIEAVQKVLDEMGCIDGTRPQARAPGKRGAKAHVGNPNQRTMLVLNKIDRISDATVRPVLAQKYPEAIFVSAATGAGVEKLNDLVIARSGGGTVHVTIRANCTNGRLMQFIGRHAQLSGQSYSDSTMEAQATLALTSLDELAKFGKDIEIIPIEV